jgi:hypothetical protein
MTETPCVGVRFVGLNVPSCPHFQVDHAMVRLVCTYWSPTSEWIEERGVHRSLLAGRRPGLTTQPYAGMRPFDAARRSTLSCSRTRHGGQGDACGH